MERNGFHPSSFETSGDKPDDSKETTKSKKKKSAESTEPAPENKKEVVADRTKSLLDKFLGDQKPEKPSHTEEDNEANASPRKTESDDQTETGSEVDAEQPAAETEATEEYDPSLEELTAAEDADITRSLVEEKIAELEAEEGDDETPEEAAGREAALTMLEQMRDEAAEYSSARNQTDAENEPEAAPETDVVAAEVPEELDDEQTIPLGKTTQLSGRPSGGSGPPPPFVRSVSSGDESLPSASGAAGTSRTHRPPITTHEKTEYVPDYHENPNRTYLLVGGLVGYLLGRRRGRIKTEKRLAVVQRKLEKQVEAKQREIAEKTETVRKMARQNYEQRQQTRSFAESRSMERPAAKRSFENMESAASRRTSTVPETAASTATAAEMAKAETPRRAAERHNPNPEKSIELSDEDITRLSETITIGATNLRKIHEAKLITDGGLRRLVNEHLQGKDIRRGLAREFLTKELSYERDPHFRDIVPIETTNARAGARAGSVATAPNQPLALDTDHPTSVPSAQSLAPIPAPKARRSGVSTGVISVLSLVALALAAYAVWLGLTR